MSEETVRRAARTGMVGEWIGEGAVAMWRRKSRKSASGRGGLDARCSRLGLETSRRANADTVAGIGLSKRRAAANLWTAGAGRCYLSDAAAIHRRSPMTSASSVTPPTESSRSLLWLGVVLLIVGFFCHFFAARAIGGTYIAYRDHLLGFVLLTVVSGLIVWCTGTAILETALRRHDLHRRSDPGRAGSARVHPAISRPWVSAPSHD